MVFQVQPSSKRKATIGYRKKKGVSYQNHQEAMANIEVVVAPEADAPGPDPADDPAAEAACPPPKKRKDANWRVNRAVLSANKATAKAVAQRDAVMEENDINRGKIVEANARLKVVEHERYQERKANQAIAMKLEEEHKYALSKVVEKFYEDIQEAYNMADVETSKRLAKEERCIHLRMRMLESCRRRGTSIVASFTTRLKS